MLVKKYGLDVLELSPTELSKRVNDAQKTGYNYFDKDNRIYGLGALSHVQDFVDSTKESGVWDAVWSVGLTVAAIRNAQTFDTNKSIAITVETTTNSKILPTNKPNSIIRRVDLSGNLISERFFDSQGRAVKDIHYTDHGNPKMHPKVPHEHIWDWSDPKNPRPSK